MPPAADVSDDPVTPDASVVPVSALAGALAAAIAVLHDNPLFVVHNSALPAVEHDGTAVAVGDADMLVGLANIVLAVCVAMSPSVTRPVAVNDPVIVGFALGAAPVTCVTV